MIFLNFRRSGLISETSIFFSKASILFISVKFSAEESLVIIEAELSY